MFQCQRNFYCWSIHARHCICSVSICNDWNIFAILCCWNWKYICPFYSFQQCLINGLQSIHLDCDITCLIRNNNLNACVLFKSCFKSVFFYVWSQIIWLCPIWRRCQFTICVNFIIRNTSECFCVCMRDCVVQNIISNIGFVVVSKFFNWIVWCECECACRIISVEIYLFPWVIDIYWQQCCVAWCQIHWRIWICCLFLGLIVWPETAVVEFGYISFVVDINHWFGVQVDEQAIKWHSIWIFWECELSCLSVEEHALAIWHNRAICIRVLCVWPSSKDICAEFGYCGWNCVNCNIWVCGDKNCAARHCDVVFVARNRKLICFWRNSCLIELSSINRGESAFSNICEICWQINLSVYFAHGKRTLFNACYCLWKIEWGNGEKLNAIWIQVGANKCCWLTADCFWNSITWTRNAGF